MNIKKRQEVINLMPWYNLGKLSPEEKTLVEAALIEDPSLKDQLKLDQDIMARIIAEPALLDKSAFAPSTVRLDKVLSQIDDLAVKSTAENTKSKVKKEKPPVDMFAGIKSFFSGLLSGSSHSFTYAVFAALTVVQLALLIFFIVPSAVQPENVSIVAGDESRIVDLEMGVVPAENNVVLRIIMKDNVGIDDIAEVLKNELSDKIEIQKVVDGETQPK